jgi:ribosomal protein L7/L12
MGTEFFFVIAALICICLLLLTLNRQVSDKTLTRVRSLERKVDQLCAKLGIESNFEAEFHARIAVLVAQGRKVEAIEDYRGETGAGLKEAKEAVERIARERKEAISEKSDAKVS